MTEDQAVAIATSMAAGTTEPIAINDVNRTARAQVCRHFIGFAVVEIEKTENHDGSLFMLAGFRLTEGGGAGLDCGLGRPVRRLFPFAWNLERPGGSQRQIGSRGLAATEFTFAERSSAAA